MPTIIIINDIKYLIGLNAKDNWNIIDNAKQNYIWFHIDKLPSAHIIMESNDITKKNIINGALLCKDNSKYNSKVSIIYTEIKNIRKGKNIGEVYVKNKCNKILI